MRKTLLLSFAFLGSIFALKGQSSSLVLKLTDGTTQTTALSSVRKLSFSGTSMILSFTSGSTQSVEESLISKIMFSDVSSAVEEVNKQSTDLSVYPNPSHEYIRICNLSDDATTYSLYNSEGHLIQSGQLTASDTKITISQLPQGLYMVRINNTTLKFIKL